MLRCALPALFVLPAVTLADPPAVTFEDVAQAAGLHGTVPGNTHIEPPPGGQAIDVNRDGWVDVYQPMNVPGTPNRLFINQGNGTFVDQAAAWGLADNSITRSALFFDYDDDGWLDVVLCNMGYDAGVEYCVLRLLWHDPQQQQFVDVTAGSGLDFVLPGLGRPAGLAAGDLDDDGALDLVIGSARLEGGVDAVDLFFRNNGDGTFTEARSLIGFTDLSRTWQVHFGDLDLDGRIDLFLSSDTLLRSRVYRNLAPWSMTDVASAVGISSGAPDMGIALGDYDNDGDFDVYVTDITFQCILPQNFGLNRLFENQVANTGTLSFSEVARARNASSSGVGWGCTWVDIDNDAWLDLAVASLECDSLLFHNQGNGDLLSVGGAIGFAPPGEGGGIIALDHDRDGDRDILLFTQDYPIQLYENVGGTQTGNWLVVDPVQRGRNPAAIGAIVRVSTGPLEQMRQITAGCSFRSQEPDEAHFGLGSATVVDRIEVTWPGGAVTTRLNVPANQRIEITRRGTRRIGSMSHDVGP